MHGNDIIEELEDLVVELQELNISIPVVVEGRRDVKALREIGLRGKIIVYNQGLSMVNFAEKVSIDHSRVLLLPDWDHKGIQLLKGWRDQFRALDVGVNDDIWVRLMKLTKKEITCVEDIDNLLFRLRDALN